MTLSALLYCFPKSHRCSSLGMNLHVPCSYKVGMKDIEIQDSRKLNWCFLCDIASSLTWKQIVFLGMNILCSSSS
jgi:hypothetical protein